MFKDEFKVEKRIADEYRSLYLMNEVSREEAMNQIMPYIDAFNKKSAEIAKKYGMKPKKISFIKYVR